MKFHHIYPQDIRSDYFQIDTSKFTKPQNHRMVEVGSKPWGSFCLTPLLSKNGQYMTILGNLFHCSVIFTLKKSYLMIRQNPLCFSLCSLLLVLSLGITEKTLTPSSLHSPFRYLYTLMRSP